MFKKVFPLWHVLFVPLITNYHNDTCPLRWSLAHKVSVVLVHRFSLHLWLVFFFRGSCDRMWHLPSETDRSATSTIVFPPSPAHRTNARPSRPYPFVQHVPKCLSIYTYISYGQYADSGSMHTAGAVCILPRAVWTTTAAQCDRMPV